MQSKINIQVMFKFGLRWIPHRLKKIKYLVCLVAKKVREKMLQIEFFFFFFFFNLVIFLSIKMSN